MDKKIQGQPIILTSTVLLDQTDSCILENSIEVGSLFVAMLLFSRRCWNIKVLWVGLIHCVEVITAFTHHSFPFMQFHYTFPVCGFSGMRVSGRNCCVREKEDETYECSNHASRNQSRIFSALSVNNGWRSLFWPKLELLFNWSHSQVWQYNLPTGVLTPQYYCTWQGLRQVRLYRKDMLPFPLLK